MSTKTRSFLAVATSVVALVAGQAAFADGATVHINLWDSGEMAMDSLGEGPNMGYAMDGVGMATPTMGITADVTAVPAGEVTFVATNSSELLEHEMLISPLPENWAPLPYDEDIYRVPEDQANALGEVPEVAPGEEGSLTITLEPGHYILYCNVAGHYQMGMWTLFDVTG